MIIETKIDYPTNHQKPLVENTAAYCFIGDIERDYMGDGVLVVKQDECDAYSCDEYFPIVPPPITLEKQLTIDYPNLQLCDPITDVFTGAYFRPLFDNILDDIKDELLAPFAVFACFDKDEKIWKFKVNNGTGFKLRVIEDLCYSNLEGFVLIKNAATDLFNKIPDEKVCQALNDFEDQKRYYRGGVRDGAFIIESALKNHEEVHEWTFTYLVNKTLDDEFFNETYDEIMTFKESLTLAKECGQLFSNSQNSKSRAKTEYEYVMAEFIEKLKQRYDRYKQNTFSLGGVDYSVSEILAQWNRHVQLEINLYQSNLELFRDTEDCNYKRGKVFEELIYEKILEVHRGN